MSNILFFARFHLALRHIDQFLVVLVILVIFFFFFFLSVLHPSRFPQTIYVSSLSGFLPLQCSFL